jgi:hypothetical protein
MRVPMKSRRSAGERKLSAATGGDGARVDRANSSAEVQADAFRLHKGQPTGPVWKSEQA